MGVKLAAIPTVVEEIRIVAAILSFICTPPFGVANRLKFLSQH